MADYDMEENQYGPTMGTFQDFQRTNKEGTCADLFSLGVNPAYLPESDRVLRALCYLLKDSSISEETQERMILHAKRLPNIGVLNYELLFEALSYFYSSLKKLTPGDFDQYCDSIDDPENSITNEKKIDFLRYLYYIHNSF